MSWSATSASPKTEPSSLNRRRQRGAERPVLRRRARRSAAAARTRRRRSGRPRGTRLPRSSGSAASQVTASSAPPNLARCVAARLQKFSEARHDFAPVPGPGLSAPHLRRLVLGELRLERDARDGDAGWDRHHRARRGDGHAAAIDDDAAFGALRDLSRVRAETDGAGGQGLGQGLRERGVAAVHAKRARTARCHRRRRASACPQARGRHRPSAGEPTTDRVPRDGGDVRFVGEPRPRRPQVRALGVGKHLPPTRSRASSTTVENPAACSLDAAVAADPRAHDHDVAVQGLGGRRHLGTSRRGHRARHQKHSREGGETWASSDGGEESRGV